ncbi:MAG: outer membrane beta-barrel protein [Bacteroidota bacterium]
MLCIISTIAPGQFKDVGIKGGAAFSLLNVENARNESHRNGFHIGIYTVYQLYKKVNLESGIFYYGKGATFETRDRFRQRVLNKANVDYIGLPVRAKYKLFKYFELRAGIYVNYLSSVNFTRETDSSVNFSPIDRDNFNNLDIGYIMGISFQFDALTLTYEYDNSFSDQFRGESGSRVLGQIKNSSSQIAIGFNFLKNK